MDDRCGVDFGDSQQDAIAKLLPGLHPDVPKKGARHLAEKGLHDIEPRSISWRPFSARWRAPFFGTSGCNPGRSFAIASCWESPKSTPHRSSILEEIRRPSLS